MRVSAVLDFEMVMAGDGAVDLAWLFYQDGRDADDLAAILRGYGTPDGVLVDYAGLRHRLLLYQVHYALGHLWWEVGFRDEAGTARVLARLRDLLAALEPSRIPTWLSGDSSRQGAQGASRRPRSPGP